MQLSIFFILFESTYFKDVLSIILIFNRTEKLQSKKEKKRQTSHVLNQSSLPIWVLINTTNDTFQLCGAKTNDNLF